MEKRGERLDQVQKQKAMSGVKEKSASMVCDDGRNLRRGIEEEVQKRQEQTRPVSNISNRSNGVCG